MIQFIKRLFSTTEKKSAFPKISPGFRLEGIEYETETNSLYVEATIIGDRRLYTESINKWRNEKIITNFEKEEIFVQLLQFISKKGKKKPVVIINIDHEREFWEDLCNKYKDQIKEIEYDSNERIENFQYNTMLKTIQNNGTLIFNNIIVKTEAELIEYWKNRKTK